MTRHTDRGRSENGSPAIIDASSMTHTPSSGERCEPRDRRTVWKLMLGNKGPQCPRAARARIPRMGRGSPDNRAMLKPDSPSRTVRVLTLARRDRLNAMTAELCGALHEELDRTA